MKKLLVICGPTATGKTSLALHLSKLLASGQVADSEESLTRREGTGPVGEIVSADSRQVYKGMDIGTGKDLPVSSKFKVQSLKLGRQGIGYYDLNGVKVWGYDLVEPTEEFSVAQYVQITRKVINDIWERGKLPILVGGTGLYIKGVVDGIPTSSIPKNRKLRESLEGKGVEELFEILAGIDPAKAASMNSSDRKNPRRLVRAIEVGKWKWEVRDGKIDNEVGSWITNKSHISHQFLASHFPHRTSILFIGLTAPRAFLNEKIEERVMKRLKQGLEDEIRNLIGFGVNWNHQSMNTLGYKEWKDYLSGRKNKNQAIQEWKRDERKYAKRQITWFKKDERIKWFDITNPNWQKDVVMLVGKWHNK